MKNISERDFDVLGEILNIGVGKAADTLSQIVHRKIILHVPRVSVLQNCTQSRASRNWPCFQWKNKTLIVSTITFTSTFPGTANLIFPADEMHEFIALCNGNSEAFSSLPTEFNDIDFDILNEIGNIVLNSIIGEICNLLNVSLTFSLPEVQIYSQPTDFYRKIELENNSSLLILSVAFLIARSKINGAVLIDLTSVPCEELFHLLSRIEEKFFGN